MADIGCGSGVLAIAAVKAGCKEVLASDMDPMPLLTSDNAALNRAAPHIRVFEAGLAHPAYIGRRFDVIFANIATSLIKLAADFEAICRPGGLSHPAC